MKKTLTLTLVVCVAFCLVALSSPALGDGAKSKESADRALQKELDRQKWYSASDGAAKFLPLRPVKFEKPQVEAPKRRLNLGKLGEWIAISSIALCVILAIILLVFAYRRREKRLKLELDEITKRKRRVESLAEEARDSYDDLKGAYRRAADEGDYRSAVIFFFSWVLVECDKAELILLDKGKTNLEYWREFDPSDPERELYVAAMQVFERVYFGDESIDRAEFQGLESQTPKFEQALATRAEELEKERLAREAAKNQMDAARWKQGATVSRIVVMAALLSLFAGCRHRDDYWSEEYVAQHWDVSLNGESEFIRYCGARYKTNVDAVYSYSLAREDLDVVVWFADVASMNCDDRFLFLYAENSDDPERQAAYDRCLERYASCDPQKDWTKFVVPPTNQVLYANSIEWSGKEDTWQSVVEWLSAKPNRVFVCFFSDYDATRDYWDAAQKEVKKTASSATREGYLRQCRDRIEGARLNNLCQERSRHIESLATRRRAALDLLKMRERGDSKYLQGRSHEDDEDRMRRHFFRDKAASGVNMNIFAQKDLRSSGIDLGDDWDDEEATIPFSYDNPRVARSNVWCRSVYRDYDLKVVGEPEEAKFTGDPSWLVGLPEKFPLREGRALVPNEAAGAKTLLALGNVPLVVEKEVGKGKILFVNSTSFINNFGLVDPTNRVLARRLADEMEPKNDGRIVFIRDMFTNEAPRENSTFSDKLQVGKFSLTKTSPFTYFAWHMIALAAIFFMICWPIFGRPKRLVRERASDFSRHIEAYGEWLKSTNAVRWSREHIDAFNEQYGRRVEEVAERGDREANEPNANASSKDGET